MKRFLGSILLSTFLALSISQAQTVQLWQPDGDLAYHYDQLANTLKPGKLLELEPGRVVEIKKFLGHGTNTLVYEIEDGKAIRIPLQDGLSAYNVYVPAFIQYYFDGYQKLKLTDIPIVKVYEELSDPSRFLVVEALEVISLEEMLKENLNHPALAELEDFARKTWQVRSVGDSHTGQLFYTHKGWVLGDFTSSVKEARSKGDATIFSNMRGLPVFFKWKLGQVVEDERRQKMTAPKPSLFSELKCSFLLLQRRLVEVAL